MRVLLVLEAALGGTGRHIVDLAGGLLDLGVEVSLFYSARRADRQFLSRLASLHVNQPAFRSRSVPISREVTFSDFPSHLQLSRYIRDHGPFDVIHAHSTKAGFLARLQWNCGHARIVYTPHGLMTLNPELTGIRRRAVCALESTLAHRSDVIIAVSEAELRCAIQTGIGPSKLVVIPNGIPKTPREVQLKSRESIRGSMGLSSNDVCIGFVGRLVPYKRPERVIEAFTLLRRRISSNLRLAIIGEGPQEASLRRAVAHLGIEDSIQFLGPVNGSAHMPAFDILAHASNFEAFGYVLVEAMSAGVPVVTTRVGGTDELITDGVTGYVCDPWNPNTFADYLQLLIDHPQRRASMSIAARQRAARYGVVEMVDSISQLYARICAPSYVASATPAKYKSLPSISK